MKRSRSNVGSGGRQSRRPRGEARLIQRAKRGDQKAIGELYSRHVDAIYRYMFGRVRDEQAAEDLTAQVFLKAIEGLPTYEDAGKPFLAWLYRIAYARVVDHWRKEERRQEVPLDDMLPARNPPPGALLEAEADWRLAMELVAQLTDDQQDVLMLRFIGEMSLSEVAEILGKTVGATKAVQHRALASLARLMEEHGGP